MEITKNETTIQPVGGYVIIQHRDPVREWRLLPVEARAVASGLLRMAEQAEAQQG